MAARNPRISRAEGYALSYATERLGSINSSRNRPGTAPSADTIASVGRVAVNGRKVITPQRASVDYLTDARKLLLPKGMYDTLTVGPGDTGGRANMVFKTLLSIAGVTPIPADQVHPRVIASDDATLFATDLLDMHTVVGAHADPSKDRLGIQVKFEVGTYAEDGTFRGRADADEEAYQTVVYKWGDDDADCVYLSTLLNSGQAADANAAAAMAKDEYQDQLSDFISGLFSLNYSVVDAGFLAGDAARWSDEDSKETADMSQYTVELSPYSMAMVSALNLKAVGEKARLAWTRAYGVAFGLVPAGSSRHNLEFQLTEVLPENSELSAVVAAHPDGEEGQRYARGCMSLIAAFGALHLANDHTYKDTDESLKRKARVMVEACRTTLAEDEPAELSAATVLNTTMRTTCHPFGLSSTWGTFKAGQHHKMIAEPLQIRDAVVPPPIAKVGLVVSVMGKIFALPVGKLFADNFGSAVADLRKLKTEVVAKSPAYSDLFKHYGYDSQEILTAEHNTAVANLMPIVSAYSLVFELTEDGEPMGALLSWTIKKCIATQSALVQLYRAAFEKYAEDAQSLEVLVKGSASAAAGTSTSTA